MQITEKLRSDILFALPKLPVKDATSIARKCEVHRDTVYRTYRKLRLSKDPVEQSPVILELARLAARRVKKVKAETQQLEQIEKQLSECK